MRWYAQYRLLRVSHAALGRRARNSGEHSLICVRDDPISELNLPLFDIQSVPGKGKGIVARFNIAKGKRILCEEPLFTSPNLSPLSEMESNIATKLKSLSKTE